MASPESRQSQLVTCDEDHRYRRIPEAGCPECALTPAGQPAVGRSDPSESSTSAPQVEVVRPPAQVQRPERSRRADWVAIAWVVGIIGLAVATNWNQLTSSFATDNSSNDQEALGALANVSNETSTTEAETPQTTIDPDAGWTAGACIEESAIDGSVSVVPCFGSTDGEIVATPLLESQCPARYTHVVDLDSGVACLVLNRFDGFDSQHCTFDGIPLYGSVFFTDSTFGYDMSVAPVDSTFLADLQVFAVENSWEADSCGLWHVVDSASQADLIIAIADSELFADFTIAGAESTWEAGT